MATSQDTQGAGTEMPEDLFPDEQDDSDARADRRAVGQGSYVVRQGDCLESIACEHGHFWETIWNDPANAELKNTRQDPDVILPGDRLTIPEIRAKDELAETDQQHQFRRRGVPSRIRMILRDEDGQPRGDEEYVIDIDGKHTNGKTRPDGSLEHPIPPNAKLVRLWVGPDRDEYEFSLGHVDPITEVSGIQERLNNLEFDCGEINGVLNKATRRAICEFQARYELEQTGEPDEQTRNKLEKVYGC